MLASSTFKNMHPSERIEAAWNYFTAFLINHETFDLGSESSALPSPSKRLTSAPDHAGAL